MTESSPIAAQPERFGVRLLPAPKNAFSNYILKHDAEPCAADHDRFRAGLHRTADLFTSGLGLDRPAHSWFAGGIPSTTLAPDFVRQHLTEPSIASKIPELAPSAPALPEKTFPLKLTV